MSVLASITPGRRLRVFRIIALVLSVTDLINRIVQVLREDLYWVRISAQDTELIKLVKPWDKG